MSELLLANAPSAAAWRLAYSGGVDSTVLLHLAAKAGMPGLQAVHVHHGLQSNADAWAQHCAATCQQWRVPLHVERVSIDPNDAAGPEAAARAARYAALHRHLPDGGVLMTAHHRDDQAETVLLRLLRGTGVGGLAAMRPLLPWGAGQLWRPLLRYSRAELLAYAQEQGLRWIEDGHNTQPRYARSYLRAEVMPALHQRWPDLAAQLSKAAELSDEASGLLEQLAAQDLAGVGASASDPFLSIAALARLDPARRNNLLRYWLQQRSLPLPHRDTLQLIGSEVMAAGVDAEPRLAWPGGEFRRYRDHLYALACLPPEPLDWSSDWDGLSILVLPAGCGVLSGEGDTPDTCTVRFGHGGEALKPVGSPHTRRLKQLFQQAGIPPWQRRRMPMIFFGGELIAVADLWRSVSAPQAWRLHWSAPEGFVRPHLPSP